MQMIPRSICPSHLILPTWLQLPPIAAYFCSYSRSHYLFPIFYSPFPILHSPSPITPDPMQSYSLRSKPLGSNPMLRAAIRADKLGPRSWRSCSHWMCAFILSNLLSSSSSAAAAAAAAARATIVHFAAQTRIGSIGLRWESAARRFAGLNWTCPVALRGKQASTNLGWLIIVQVNNH